MPGPTTTKINPKNSCHERGTTGEQVITDEDKSVIAEYVAQQIEARAGAARVASEMVVEAVSEVAEQDLRLVFRDALKDAADAIRKQSEDEGDMLDLMADELKAYVQQLEDEEQV